MILPLNSIVSSIQPFSFKFLIIFRCEFDSPETKMIVLRNLTTIYSSSPSLIHHHPHQHFYLSYRGSELNEP